MMITRLTLGIISHRNSWTLPPYAKLNFPTSKTFNKFRVPESFSSDTDAAAGAAATAAASAAAFVLPNLFTVVATVPAPAAASVSEGKDSWTLNVINVLVLKNQFCTWV